MEGNTDESVENKTNFFKTAWEKTAPFRTGVVRFWKAIRNPIAWILASVAIATIAAGVVSMSISRKNAPRDANGRQFSYFEEVVFPSAVQAQLEQKRQDSILEARKDSIQHARAARADSIERAQKAAKEAKAKKKGRRTSQLNIDGKERTGLAIGRMKQQQGLAAAHFSRVQAARMRA